MEALDVLYPSSATDSKTPGSLSSKAAKIFTCPRRVWEELVIGWTGGPVPADPGG